jgi:hypothetical protein
MKRTLFHLSLICLVIGLLSMTTYAQEIFSVTAVVKDVGAGVLEQGRSQVKEGFILVPEPSSIVLFASGALALIRYRSKRNRKNN